MPTLYTLSQRFAELHARIDDFGSVDAGDCGLSLALAEFDHDAKRKVSACVAFIRQAEMEAEELDKRIEELEARAIARHKAVSRVKDNLHSFLTLIGETKFPTDSGVACVQKNGGKLPVELSPDIDVNAVPDRFCKTIRSVVVDNVREALEDGEELPFAKLGERGTHLRIR